MKKFFAVILALAMVFAMGTTAFAEEIVHDGALPDTSEQAVTITISGLTNESEGGSPDTSLPSEYHVIVNWKVQNGVYDATATDEEGEGGFQNFSWDCVKLQYNVNEGKTDEEGNDIREGNWTTKPSVAFEVINASTPDLTIYAAASLKTADAWAPYMKATSIVDQNTAIGKQAIAPVEKANMGTGIDSYELGVTEGDAHNDYDYEYELNWDYDALNAAALAAYKADTGSQDFTNTFVVTITAE